MPLWNVTLLLPYSSVLSVSGSNSCQLSLFSLWACTWISLSISYWPYFFSSLLYCPYPLEFVMPRIQVFSFDSCSTFISPRLLPVSTLRYYRPKIAPYGDRSQWNDPGGCCIHSSDRCCCCLAELKHPIEIMPLSICYNRFIQSILGASSTLQMHIRDPITKRMIIEHWEKTSMPFDAYLFFPNLPTWYCF